MDNILIDIGADTKEFLSGLAEVGDNTESLGDRLQSIGTVAAAAFAGYTASIMGAVYAYRQEEEVGQQVNSVIQSTGGIAGVTADAVSELADSFSKTTTFSKLSVEQGEEVLLTFTQIGKDTFPQATKATLDLAQGMGTSTASAAQILGRALQDPMNATTRLTREGITFTAQQKAQMQQMELSGNIAGAQAIILQAVSDKFGGMATAAAGGTGQLVVLKNSMEDLAAHIGAEFAPYVAEAATKLNELVQFAAQHEGVVEFTAAILAGGAAVTGIVTALAAGNAILPVITSAIEVATGAVGAFGLASKIAMGATGLGLLFVVGSEVYEHWNQMWPAMLSVYQTFVTAITSASAAVGRVIKAAFSLNLDDLKAGLAAVENAFAAAAQATVSKVDSIFTASPTARQVATDAGTQLGKDQALARQKALQAGEDQTRAWQAQAIQANLQAEALQYAGFTKTLVDLKKQEAATLKQLSTSQNAQETAMLNAHLTDIRNQYNKAALNEAKQRATFDKLKKKEGQSLSTAEIQQLTGTIQTEEDAQHAFYVQQLQDEIAAHNQFLADQARFGTAYATIDEAMRSTVLTQADSSFTQLSQLTQSKNDELKAIGKAASIADIEIKGAQGAMAAYSGFASIPIVGIALGLAAAAAIEIYAQERVGQVLAANSGGVVTGGIPGVDSVPALLTPGELVVPQQNFDEVVGAVSANRRGGGAGAQSSQPQVVQVQLTVSAKPGLARYLQIQTVQDKAMGTYRGT